MANISEETVQMSLSVEREFCGISGCCQERKKRVCGGFVGLEIWVCEEHRMYLVHARDTYDGVIHPHQAPRTSGELAHVFVLFSALNSPSFAVSTTSGKRGRVKKTKK